MSAHRSQKHSHASKCSETEHTVQARVLAGGADGRLPDFLLATCLRFPSPQRHLRRVHGGESEQQLQEALHRLRRMFMGAQHPVIGR